MRVSPNAGQRNDLRATPLDAITLASVSAERRAAFGNGAMVTGPPPHDPVTGRRPDILARPLLPERTHGIDLYL